VAATLPEGAIVSDESATSGFRLGDAMVGAPRHDVLALTGGAIGQGLPVAVGAAVACPDRRVLALEADGSAMYTISALWTMAREQLNTTVVILDNGAYAILRIELQRVGADVGSRAAEELFDLTRPRIDFAALGTSLGVPSTRAVTADELTAQLERSFAEPGPHLIHAVLAPRA
jgi:acetolactate synthase-1/2/3 large subunit